MYITTSNHRKNRQLRQANAEKANTDSEFKSLVKNLKGGVFSACVDSNSTDFNITLIGGSFTKMTGYSIEDIRTIFNGSHMGMIVPEDREIVQDEFNRYINKGNTFTLQYRVVKKDGTETWVFNSGQLALEKDGIKKVHCVLIDFTSIKEREAFLINKHREEAAKLKEKARRDSLTGFYNKQSTEDIINGILLSQPEPNGVLFMLDIDNFKKVNDTFGHMHGDKVILDIAANLNSVFRSGDIIGRIGGDEFIVFTCAFEGLDSICDKAQAVCNVIQKEFICRDKLCNVSCSIGIAIADSKMHCFGDLYSAADIALYKSKEKGKNCFSVFPD